MGSGPPLSREAQAETAEERYRAFVQNSSEGIWRLEFDPPLDTSLPIDEQVELAYRHGVLTECNDAMARMYGLQRSEELIGASLDSMLPSTDPAARAYMASVIEAGYKVTNVESTERDVEGGVKHFANSMSGVVEDGRLLRIWGTQRDITEQKRIEQALRDSEARFRYMGDAAPVMLWIGGLDSGRTWFNARWLQFVGRPMDRELGSGWSENVHPDDVVQCLDSYSKAFDESRPFTMEYRLKRHDGEYRWVLDTGVPIDEAGVFAGYIGSSIDITDRKREADASAYLAAIVESSDDAILAKDLNGIIRSCNATAERLFGYTASELIGRPVRMLIPDDRQQEEDLILGRIRAGQRVEHFETVRITKDRRLIDISLTISPVRDASGAIIGVSKIARDITERRRIEAERHIAAADRERLLEAERIARAEAERASRIKDEFVAMVSHELRTPLNAILGWTQLMMRGRHDATVLDRGLDVISRNTRAQAQLIADLLDISRIVSGKLRLETQSVDMRAMFDDAIETVEGEAEAKGIVINKTVAEDIGPVAGDPARLQQVVWNLLSNAIKFTPRGGHIAVSLTQANGSAEIAVKDTGVGIRADVLPHVFDRFHQADRSITRRFGGLGLGLSIVKHLVELHGGTVHAESSGEGQGSVFAIRLPIARLPLFESGDAPLAPVIKSTETVALESLRVLLVEDEPDTLEYLQRLLEEHGGVIFAARSASEALALFRRERPEMLISDIGLPEIDGYDLIREIRREHGHASETIPAIALTAYARSEDRMRALRAGFHAHIAKPAEPAELLATIVSLAKLRDRRR
jgi:PAS domain S-box-containing protein